jgi:hypothetical protein
MIGYDQLRSMGMPPYLRPDFNVQEHLASPDRKAAIARKRKKTKNKRGDGLGDRLERKLKSIGITEDRYKQVKEKFGLPPNCNCKARKEWLNSVSEWWTELTTVHSAPQ